jgi:CRISPR-associated helicase Cas3/CRISPR-associated endonuclease Cas3-HD
MKWAHSEGWDGRKEVLATHLSEVAALAAERAEIFGARKEAHCLGVWHDLGKLGEPFQLLLEGKAARIDHWSLAAAYALKLLGQKGRAAILAILGHHLGIPAGNRESIRRWLPPEIYRAHPSNLTLSPGTYEELELLMENEAIPSCDTGWDPLVPDALFSSEPARAMLRTRMLYSCLVDADFIATERHFAGPHARARGPLLEPEKLWSAFRQLLQEARRRPCSETVREVRESVLCSALEAAESEAELFTLTAPTGSGKTLAMLGFALRRSALRGHRRIILALPYLALLQEVVQIYHRLLEICYPCQDPRDFMLEAHSMSDDHPIRMDEDDRTEAARRKLVENWDAPLIVTTNVQLLESLHANRPMRCRKLHNIANSVIMMDEVQTLPRELALPTLAALSTLAADFRCSVLLATATQPAFEAFDTIVKERMSRSGWRPREAIPEPARLFRALQRVSVQWHLQNGPWTEDEVVGEMMRQESALCIVNLKRHARAIFTRLRESDPDALFLATSLCPAHRVRVLEEVRRRLDSACARLVSTQCVEAGVDLDFPCVFRAFGPLEAIAQAAGRCNRHGRRAAGQVIVFELKDDRSPRYPDLAYERAAQVCRVMLSESGYGLDISSPDTFRKYYQRLYGVELNNLKDHDAVSAVRRLDFPEVAALYRLIPDTQISVLVPYDLAEYEALRQEAFREGLTNSWIRRARAHAVSLYRPPRESPLWSALDTVPVRPRGEAADWFILRDPTLYHPQMGLTIPQECGFLEG